MSVQKVDTEGIAAAANAISTADANINNAFEQVRKIGMKMDESWNSSAGTIAETTLQQLITNNDARSTVLQNYVNILNQLVNPSYIEAENVNTKLSDMFL